MARRLTFAVSSSNLAGEAMVNDDLCTAERAGEDAGWASRMFSNPFGENVVDGLIPKASCSCGGDICVSKKQACFAVRQACLC